MSTDGQRDAAGIEEGRGGGPGTERLHCLVTGASGYIGGRLVPELHAAGHRVRCLARFPDELRDHPWAREAEAVGGDVTDAESVAAAMRGVDVGQGHERARRVARRPLPALRRERRVRQQRPQVRIAAPGVTP